MSAIQYVPYLDGWRGLAIACLFIGHFLPVPGINFGLFGVNLFFVLSGLLMARLLFEKSVPIKVFYLRRIARIFPAVFAYVFLLIIGYVFAGRQIDWLSVASAVTFTNNYIDSGTGPWRMPLGHIWSLSVEEHCYIMLSLFAVLGRRTLANPTWLMILATGVIAFFNVYYWMVATEADMFTLILRTEVAGFGIFASAAILLCIRGRQIPSLPGYVFMFLLAFSIAMHWWSVAPPIRTIAGVGALALAVNLLAGAPGWLHAALSLAPLRQLGLWSFSLYIWQQPFYMYYHYYGMNQLLAFVLALGCGIASFYLIEQPSRKWLNRRWGRTVPPSHAEATEGQKAALMTPGSPIRDPL